MRGEEQRREDNVVMFKYVPKEPGVWQLHVDVLNLILLLYIYNNIMYYQCISAMVLYCCILLLQRHLRCRLVRPCDLRGGVLEPT